MFAPQQNKAAAHHAAPDHIDDLENRFKDLMNVNGASETQLAQAICYVTNRPGSFIRARLALQVGRTCGLEIEIAERIAIAVEYFHTASLIFDDLSSMDDAETRRGSRCVHQIYGEATAMLTALAFINRAYALIWHETSKLLPTVSRDVTKFVENCLGPDGVLKGQSQDLNFSPEENSPRKILEISMGKTVTLLQLSLCLPAMIANAPDRTISLLRRLAVFRGLGYQIADDFKDVFLSEEQSGKSSDRDRTLCRPNLVVSEGVPAAAHRLEKLVAKGDRTQRLLTSRRGAWRFLNELRITAGPELINENGIPISGSL